MTLSETVIAFSRFCIAKKSKFWGDGNTIFAVRRLHESLGCCVVCGKIPTLIVSYDVSDDQQSGTRTPFFQNNTDYSEWFLGHSHSPYWTLKEAERRETYKNRCMSALTFLDYSHIEATGRSIDAKLEEKEKEIARLRQDNIENKDAYLQIADMYQKLSERLDKIETTKK
ncbi:MAG: hypothetical protein ABJB85_10565 [Nitrososphaerota archaeon]